MVNRIRWRPARATLPMVAVYVLMTGVGVALAGPLGGAHLLAAAGDPVRTLGDVALGAGLALPALGMGWWLERIVPSLRALAREVRALLGPLGLMDVAALSLASAVGEEVLFRAVLLPGLGLVPSAIAFGAAHGLYRRPYRAWSLYAMGMGLMLGALTLWTGTIVAAVVLHATINYASFADLVPGEVASQGPGTPGAGEGDAED